MTVRGLVRVTAVLGSSGDQGWAGRLAGAQVDVLHFDQAEAQKSRLRKTTANGTEVAVSLGRGTQLRDGDVLYWDDERRAAITAHVDLGDVLVIDLSALVTRPVTEAISECVELGHALGNQHWAAVVKGLRVYVPLTVARAVMASVMKTHAFERVTYFFAPGADVAGYLTPNEARRLFGTAGGHTHNGQAS
jgi:urease accessory protein